MSSMNTRATRLGLASAGVLAMLASACTSGGGSAPSSSPPPAPSTTSSSSSKPAPKPKPKPKPKHHAAVNPLTGIGPVPKTPVIAVKIDDTAPGRPQVNIDKADVVYIEAVEGGLTRLAAIFGTRKPMVGYVRSTRPSDPDLLLQYGKITEAYSGGAHDSLPRVHRSGITSWSNDAGAPFYRRVARAKSSYINLELNLSRVARRTHTNRPKPVGFTFAKTWGKLKPHKATDIRTVVTGSYAHGTPVEFRWWPRLHKYVRYIDGVKQFAADGKPVAATNVVVQSCHVVSHPRDTDVMGNPSQFTYTVGTGQVEVFHGGKGIVGKWYRSKLSHGTSFRTFGHKPIPFATGNTWFVLIRKGIGVSR
jgi:hypothetical protein